MPDKRTERLYFAQLRQCVPDLPAGEPSEFEPPDFVLGVSPRVGVELTTFHLPAEVGHRPRQELDTLRDRTVRIAEELHSSAGGPPLYVTAAFGNSTLTKKRTRTVAELLAGAVLAASVPRSVAEGCVHLARHELPRDFDEVRIYGSVDGVDRLWHSSRTGWVAPVLPEHIQALVTRKNRSVARARTNCDLLWLVIVHNIFGYGSPAEIRKEARAATYATSFDRILWFEPHRPAVLELCVAHRLTAS